MTGIIRRVAITAGATVGGLALLTGTALAHNCVNLNKKPLAGAQIIFDGADVIMTQGLQKRVEKGLVNPDTGEGYHGIIGFVDGDFSGSTWQVTPTGSIPLQAQENGSECNGITNFDAFEACLVN